MKPNTLIMLAGGALVLYYLMGDKTPATAGGSGAGAGAGTGAGAGAGSGAGAAGAGAGAGSGTGGTSFNSLDAIYRRLVTVATAGGVNPAVGVGPDAWNTYLVLPTVSTVVTAPDPMAVFPGIDRSKAMTAVQYWSGMSDYLSKNSGLKGIGLGLAVPYPRSRFFAYGGWQA